MCVYVCGVCAGRYNEWDPGEDVTDDDARVLFVNATDNRTDLSNALALDMTYRVLYYGHQNKVHSRQAVCTKKNG